MFKKYTRGVLEKEGGIPREELSLPPDLFSLPPVKSLASPQESLEEDIAVETTLGEEVHIKGELSFGAALRIDGSFEGTLISEGKLIVGPKGSVKANISLQEAFIAGRVEGDITVKERLALRGHAKVIGNITAPLLSVDEGVSIIGTVRIERTIPNVVQKSDAGL